MLRCFVDQRGGIEAFGCRGSITHRGAVSSEQAGQILVDVDPPVQDLQENIVHRLLDHDLLGADRFTHARQ